MELNASQKDALTELINIGYARAAGALSELTGHRIELAVPAVAMYRISELTTLLCKVMSGEVASVNQVFSGPVSGNALLLLDQSAATMLNQLLTEGATIAAITPNLDASAREVITEVGNIVLNACLGVFGNLLKVQVTFAVPRLHVETVESVMSSITVGDKELRYALIAQTRFHLKSSNVSGYLVIILGVTSLERLLVEVEGWEQRQLSA
ncbi:MAG: chemotaxis protein CheC [Limisphaerales bacterium]